MHVCNALWWTFCLKIHVKSILGCSFKPGDGKLFPKNWAAAMHNELESDFMLIVTAICLKFIWLCSAALMPTSSASLVSRAASTFSSPLITTDVRVLLIGRSKVDGCADDNHHILHGVKNQLHGCLQLGSWITSQNQLLHGLLGLIQLNLENAMVQLP